MLTELSTLKQRLAIPDTEVTQDDLLTFIIEAVSARFDKETNRTLVRTVDATFEFDANDLEISVPCYLIESVTKFETKTSETEGWVQQTEVDYLIRNSCIISLNGDFRRKILDERLGAIGRVTYTAGYVLPGTDPILGQTALPSDQHAAIEQAAFWFIRRDMVGLDTSWPKGGVLPRFSKLDLLLPVAQVLQTYKRISI